MTLDVEDIFSQFDDLPSSSAGVGHNGGPYGIDGSPGSSGFCRPLRSNAKANTCDEMGQVAAKLPASH